MSEKKTDSNSTAVAVLFVLYLIGAGLYQGWLQLDRAGYLSHVATSDITASGEWIVGETRDCVSSPLPPVLADKDHVSGDMFANVDCQGGPHHKVKIEFFGRKIQPEAKVAAFWSCTRNSVSMLNNQAFTCKQTGAF